MKTLIASCATLCALVLTLAVTTAPSTGPSTSPTTAPVLTGVVVRDTGRLVATTQAVSDGGYLSSLPAHWSLQFAFSDPQPKSVAFTIDGKQPHTEYAVPWVVEGDNIAIDLPAGDHVIGYTVQGQPARTFAVSVLSSPVFGENLAGISYTASDPVLHPQMMAAVKAFNLSYIRLWIEGGFTSQQPSSYFKITREWQSAGLKVIAVANFQNAVPRCSAPADAVWTSYWTNFPSAAQTGIYAICIGNEINTPTYYTGTVPQMAHLMQLAYPLLHAKGYVVIAGSEIDDLNCYTALNKLGAFAWCDRIDMHSYYGTVPQVVAEIDKGIAFGRSIGKPCDATEFGVRMSAANLPAWAAAHQQLLTQLKTRTGCLLPFSFYPMEDLDQACPLDKNYGQNGPFYPAFMGALGKN